jgi:sugar O-acyltransferase (sialic acid O-acetyltransferase NeuD family)
MSKLLIIGAGGHGKVVAEAAMSMKQWEAVAFLDDRYRELDGSLPWPVIGNLELDVKNNKEYTDFVVAIGEGNKRLELLDRYISQGFNAPVLIQSGAWVSPSARLAAGSVVLAQAAVNASAQISRGCIINTAATVDHDCRIGCGVHICPGAHLGGEVIVGNLSWIGIGANVIQQIKIGKGVTIGAGSVVLSDVKDNLTVAGTPARVIPHDV